MTRPQRKPWLTSSVDAAEGVVAGEVAARASTSRPRALWFSAGTRRTSTVTERTPGDCGSLHGRHSAEDTSALPDLVEQAHDRAGPDAGRMRRGVTGRQLADATRTEAC